MLYDISILLLVVLRNYLTLSFLPQYLVRFTYTHTNMKVRIEVKTKLNLHAIIILLLLYYFVNALLTTYYC